MSNAKLYTSAADYVAHVEACSGDHDEDRIIDTVEALERAEASAKSANEQLARTEIAYARAFAELERLGFRRCDVAACNCGGWHQHRPTDSETAAWAENDDLKRRLAEYEKLHEEQDRDWKAATHRALLDAQASLVAQVEALKKERDHWRDEHEKRRGECLAAQMLEKAAQDRAEANLIDHGLREAALLAERDAARERLAHDTEQWLRCIKERDAARKEAEELRAKLDEWAAKDGNSPGYNLEKAKTYGRIAAEERARAEELRSALKALVEAIEAEAESSSLVDDDASVQTFVDARKALDKSKPETPEKKP